MVPLLVNFTPYPNEAMRPSCLWSGDVPNCLSPQLATHVHISFNPSSIRACNWVGLERNVTLHVKPSNWWFPNIDFQPWPFPEVAIGWIIQLSGHADLVSRWSRLVDLIVGFMSHHTCVCIGTWPYILVFQLPHVLPHASHMFMFSIFNPRCLQSLISLGGSSTYNV